MTFQTTFLRPADAGGSPVAEDRHNPHDRMARRDYSTDKVVHVVDEEHPVLKALRGSPTGRAQRRIDSSKDTGPAFDKANPWWDKSSQRLDYPQAASASAEMDFAALEARVLSYLAAQRQPCNNLTHAEAERLAMLGEECGEIAQMVGKILRFGYNSHHPDGGPTNRQLLIGELQDLLAVITLMNPDELNQSFESVTAPQAKIDRKKRYSHFQR